MSGHQKWSDIRRTPRTPGGEDRVAAMKQAAVDAAVIADLVEDRKGSGITQAALAEVLGVSKARVSAIEHQRDLYLSTLRDYVEALGGRLEVTAVFDDRRVAIEA